MHTRLFCIDEMFMLHYKLIDMEDLIMKDITQGDGTLGNKCMVVFAGDPRQLLAVVSSGGGAFWTK